MFPKSVRNEFLATKIPKRTSTNSGLDQAQFFPYVSYKHDLGNLR
jgi:hypothetical protein